MTGSTRHSSFIVTLLACALLCGVTWTSSAPRGEAAAPRVESRDEPAPDAPEAPREVPVVFELELEDAEDARHARVAAAAGADAVALPAPRPSDERDHRLPLRRAPRPSVAGHGARSPPV